MSKKRPRLCKQEIKALKRARRARRNEMLVKVWMGGPKTRPAPAKIEATSPMNYAARNQILLRLGYPNYGVYLVSSLWRKIRDEVFRRDQTTCFMCGHAACMVHHTDYSEAVLLGKNLEPLHSVCRPCHDKIEFDRSGRKRTFWEARRLVESKLKKTQPLRAAGGCLAPTSEMIPVGNGVCPQPPHEVPG